MTLIQQSLHVTLIEQLSYVWASLQQRFIYIVFMTILDTICMSSYSMIVDITDEDVSIWKLSCIPFLGMFL